MKKSYYVTLSLYLASSNSFMLSLTLFNLIKLIKELERLNSEE